MVYIIQSGDFEVIKKFVKEQSQDVSFQRRVNPKLEKDGDQGSKLNAAQYES